MEPTSDRPSFGPPPGWGQQPQSPSGPPPGWGQQAPPWGQQPPGPGPVPAAGWGQAQSWGQQQSWRPGPVWQPTPPGMEKRRRPVLLALGIVLTVVGLVGLAIGIVRIVDAVRIPDDDIVARGVIGGPAVEFERTADLPEQYTVYLDAGSGSSQTVDHWVDATTCAIELPDGTELRRDGNDLSSSVNLNGTANIGSFRTPTGTVTVSCTSSRANGAPMLVVKGGPRLGFVAFAYLFGGVAVLVGGIILTIVGAIKRWRPAKASTSVT